MEPFLALITPIDKRAVNLPTPPPGIWGGAPSLPPTTPPTLPPIGDLPKPPDLGAPGNWQLVWVFVPGEGWKSGMLPPPGAGVPK